MNGTPIFRSVRQKLFAGVLLTTLSALLIAGISLVVYELRHYREQLIEDMNTQSRLLGLACAPALQFIDRKLAADNLALIEARPQILAAAVYDASGRLFGGYSAKADAAVKFPESISTDSIQISDSTIVLVQSVIDHDERIGHIYLRGRYQPYENIWRYVGIMCAAMAFALLISMLLALWLQAKVTGPILAITQLARKVTEQRNFDLRVQKSTDDEIGYLADAFNDLLLEVSARSAALEQRVAERTAELERANKELEAFSYSVSHDLRTPLRAIDGFSQALLEDYENVLDTTGRDYLARVRAGAQRMGGLIDDLLKLARVSRTTLNKESIDLSRMATEIVNELRTAAPERVMEVIIAPNLRTIGDAHLLRIALDNLLNNAWKYTGKTQAARIEFGECSVRAGLHAGETPDFEQRCYFIADNGAGFDTAYASKLFGAFQRMHEAKDFPGTGVGLATVQRIIHRHSGQIWATAEVGKGATFFFTLAMRETHDEQSTDSVS